MNAAAFVLASLFAFRQVDPYFHEPFLPDTKVEKDTTELSSKGIEAVADASPFKRGANGSNFEFLIWLAIMIVVMLITFTVVYVIEKKKQKATRGRRFQ